MSSRDYYKVTFTNDDSKSVSIDQEILDNDTEFNANRFKLYDDFTTNLRLNYNPLRSRFHDVAKTETNRNGRRKTDPNDSGVDMENGNQVDDSSPSNSSDLLENEVMVDPWSSMDSSNSPLTDSGPSASDDCTPSTSSEPPRDPSNVSSPLSPDARQLTNPTTAKPKPAPKTVPKPTNKARSRDLTLDLDNLDPLARRPHFLDEDYQPPSKSNIECHIPKPHFLDHTPSPDELDERSDITNPNFLDDEVDGDDNFAKKKAGALPKKPQKISSTLSSADDRSTRSSYRSALHYGIDAARSSERDKRASQLYRGTWPGERDAWTGQDSSSVRSFSSNGSADGSRPSSNLENKMECVCSLISLLSLSPENNADLSGPLLDMSRSVESCIAMRQAGCIPLLVQLIHSKVARETRDRAAKALRNIIHTQTDDKAGRREARVWRLLEQVREYCYILEDVVESRKEGKELIDDDTTKHPSQSVAALMKLSFDEEHRHVVCQLGGLQALAALVSGDQAAHGSRTDDNTCLTMRKYAGMTLTNLTFGDGNNKSLLCSFKDFMLALVEQLESPNDDMRQVTAAVLRNLSWRADTSSKQVLREVGAVKGLTKAAMTCQKEATLKSVLSALWNLTAHCSMNKVALCSVDGALGFLVDMLSYNSPTKTLAIVENAGGIMRNVSSHIAIREDYRQILRERNCLSVLLQHLKSPSLTVVSNSCGTLWNLSARCPLDQQFLWDHGAVPMLRSLIHSKHKMIAMGSSAALKNLLNSKPGKSHILTLDTTARNMNLPALPTLGARKQKVLEQELDQNLAETCDNIEPATSPSTSNREEKNLFTATERQIAMNLERHRMTSSSPLMGALTSQISLSHSAQLASYLSCSNTLLKGALVSRSTASSANNVNRSDSKDSVTSAHSDSVFEKVMRTGKVPVPTPRSKDLMKLDPAREAFKVPSQPVIKEGTYRYPTQPPVPPPRTTTEMRTNYTESGYDVDQDSCDQPIDFSRKYSETKPTEPGPAVVGKPKDPEAKKFYKKESPSTFGDYQETDLDQPTDYSLRYAEHQSETGSDISEPPVPSVHEDTIKHFATEGTPYETPIIFSTATSMSDLRVIGKDKAKPVPNMKEHPEVMTHSDEKDTCSIEDPPGHDNDRAVKTPQTPTAEPVPEKRSVFDTKFSSGMISPEKPINYCDEGTPGYFSRVSSLSSLGEPTEEDSLAKRNAMASINVDPTLQEMSTSSSAKDREGSKAVTFASDPVAVDSSCGTPAIGSARASPPHFVEETPLMFSRSSSLGSLPECEQDEQQEVLSEISRMTSGCISPSEIPDSPGGSVSDTPPRVTVATPPEVNHVTSVFDERTSQFVVENTPAQFSANTSLSSLTIDTEPKQLQSFSAGSESRQNLTSDLQSVENDSVSASDGVKGIETPADTCQVYLTEDTPAILSKVGSNSDLSTLSIDSGQLDPAPRDPASCGPAPCDPAPCDSSDSSILSDAADLLEQCIQKGIDKVVKNKDPPSDIASYVGRHDVYRSLPPYLRSSTETVKLSHEYARSVHNTEGARGSPPPPLPPRAPPPPPPAPPRPRCCKPAERGAGVAQRAAGHESSSSASLDSFGSAERELFEETVRAGLSRANNRAPVGGPRRRPRSLDRAVGRARGGDWPRTGERARGAERPRARASHSLDRSGSLSDLSNDSFGSTDKEVFERSVRLGMARPAHPPPTHALLRVKKASDRALLQEMIAKGANDKIAVAANKTPPKNVAPPPATRAVVGELESPALIEHTLYPNESLNQSLDISRDSCDGRSDEDNQSLDQSLEQSLCRRGELPTVDSANTTLDSVPEELNHSNECLAPRLDQSVDSATKEDLERSNESYANVFEDSWSTGSPPKRTIDSASAVEVNSELEWTDIKLPKHDEASKCADTWNDNTCPDDVTFPTISGSILGQLTSPLHSEALPDLLETSEPGSCLSRPDLMDKLGDDRRQSAIVGDCDEAMLLDDVPEPSYVSILDDGDRRLDSMLSSAIEKEAARLAAQLKVSTYGMHNSVTSLMSLDLDNVIPPSDLGSLLSLSASGQWEDTASKRSLRKKSLPVSSMVKRALSNSIHQGSSERLDSNAMSFLDNVKPPSEMEHIDMESSMVSVSSIVSEVAEKTPVVFDLKQPIQDFPLCNNFVYQDLDKINPPSLFDEMAESTIEIDPTTAQQMYDDCMSTLNVVTDIPSGSENTTPLPSDISSVESTPKKLRDSKYLTPKEKRYFAKDRYQTYTITDSVSENDVVLEVDSEQFMTWTKSESDRSEEYVTATSETKVKRKVSAKQRRLDDRARYQTQTVDINNILQESSQSPADSSHIESLKRRLAAKKTIKQKRVEDAERFRTRTISEDIPPSPTFVTKDANFENVETTTGYDSLSSNEPNHQQLHDDACADADSGHNEDDFELNSTQMQTYTRSFRNYLPVVESPTAVDMCVVNNLKNIEMTASYRRALLAQTDKSLNPSSGDFASFEGDSNSEDRVHSDSESETPRPKPKIIKPESRHDESFDSTESLDRERDSPKAIRGRKKAMYVSPYRRTTPAAKKPSTSTVTQVKALPKPSASKALANPVKAQTNVRASIPSRTPMASKTPSANTSPKKAPLHKSPLKTLQQKPISIPVAPVKPLPLERQGTFTKEESSVPPKNLPVPDKNATVTRLAKATSPTKPGVNTSPSRLPQLNRYTRPPLRKNNSSDSKNKATTSKRASEPTMKTSTSNYSLQSNDSGKTVTLAKGSRQGSTSSVNSVHSAKPHAKDVESKIANLWKKVEQSKKQPTKPDKRVWIESDKTETPKLIRSSTFEGQPKMTQVSSAPKQKTTIGIRISQIPSLKPKASTSKANAPVSKKPTTSRVFVRKQINGQSSQ